MKNQKKGIITNEQTMKKILKNGCLGCETKTSNPEEINHFQFTGEIICSECGSIYIPETNLRLVKKIFKVGCSNLGLEEITWYTDPETTVLQDDEGINMTYSKPRIKRKTLVPNKVHSTK